MFLNIDVAINNNREHLSNKWKKRMKSTLCLNIKENIILTTATMCLSVESLCSSTW